MVYDYFNVYHYRGGDPIDTFDTEEEAKACKNKQKNPSEYFVEGDSPDYYRNKIDAAHAGKRSLFKEVKEGLEVLKKERKARSDKGQKRKPKVKPKVKVKVKAKTKPKAKPKRKVKKK